MSTISLTTEPTTEPTTGPTTGPTISILTYNILSQNLAEQMVNEIKDNKKVYDMSFMNNEYRWAKISNTIESKINESVNESVTNSSINSSTDYLIFCLQEVTEDWVSKFSQLFTKNNYKYINVQHGRVFNGNMGIMIAWPSTLTLIKSEFYTVGQHILVTDENSKLAAGKTNTAILLLLEQSNQINGLKFGVINYHMPLEPKIPHISMSHAKVLIKKINKFMEGNNWFYGGDFNITPDSRTYQYLLTMANCIWDKIETYPITNHAYIREFEFSGCLDYIFYSKNDKIKQIYVQYEKIISIIPNNIFPSDHIPVYAKFKII